MGQAIANGQYIFSCDGTGAYGLDVPLDGNGQITQFVFADGFAPFRRTTGSGGFPFNVQMQTAAPDSPLISMTRDIECSGTDRVRISGEIESFGGAPLCAMVLANGQHMFSCGESLGWYDLDVPVDENGQVTVFGFADSFQPYSDTFIAPECDVRFAAVDGVEFEYQLVDGFIEPVISIIPSIPYCILQVTATNTTSSKRDCFLTVTVYDLAGRYLAKSTVLFKLPPGITDSANSPVTMYHSPYRVERCDEISAWDLSDRPAYSSSPNPFCIEGSF